MDKQTWNQKKLEMETLEKETLTERRDTVDPETRAYISSLVSAVSPSLDAFRNPRCLLI
jgi:hypothetical protein